MDAIYNSRTGCNSVQSFLLRIASLQTRRMFSLPYPLLDVCQAELLCIVVDCNGLGHFSSAKKGWSAGFHPFTIQYMRVSSYGWIKLRLWADWFHEAYRSLRFSSARILQNKHIQASRIMTFDQTKGYIHYYIQSPRVANINLCRFIL